MRPLNDHRLFEPVSGEEALVIPNLYSGYFRNGDTIETSDAAFADYSVYRDAIRKDCADHAGQYTSGARFPSVPGIRRETFAPWLWWQIEAEPWFEQVFKKRSKR